MACDQGGRRMGQVTIQQAFEMAVECHRAARVEEAVSIYRQIIGQQPWMGAAYVNLGSALKGLGRLDEAIAVCRKAIEIDPTLPQAYSNLGDALKDKGMTGEALVACRAAVGLDPRIAESQINLGNVLKDLGDLDGAMAAYNAAIALRPGYSAGHSNLIYAMEYCAGWGGREIGEELRRWDELYARGLKKRAT